MGFDAMHRTPFYKVKPLKGLVLPKVMFPVKDLILDLL